MNVCKSSHNTTHFQQYNTALLEVSLGERRQQRGKKNKDDKNENLMSLESNKNKINGPYTHPDDKSHSVLTLRRYAP
jgi:hypothetical protein